MTIPYPCLDTGYLYDPGKKLDRIMSDFYESEWSQSYLFAGSISSFPYILQNYQDDPQTVANKTRDSLTRLVGKYFDSCEVQTGEIEGESSTSYDLRLYLTAKQGDETVNLWQQIKVTGTQFEKTLDERK